MKFQFNLVIIYLFIYFNPIIYLQFSFSIHSIRGFAVVFKNKIILVSLNFFFFLKNIIFRTPNGKK